VGLTVVTGRVGSIVVTGLSGPVGLTVAIDRVGSTGETVRGASIEATGHVKGSAAMTGPVVRASAGTTDLATTGPATTAPEMIGPEMIGPATTDLATTDLSGLTIATGPGGSRPVTGHDSVTVPGGLRATVRAGRSGRAGRATTGPGSSPIGIGPAGTSGTRDPGTVGRSYPRTSSPTIWTVRYGPSWCRWRG